ncbi:putative myosin heavy chain [Trypanosoma grayi]|uniref:putative myosin heavy chain n=1 Tax=Trypanosoma grayi TaxID=71804 RepID=UPI0004F455E9|nr:putative myosin heavy chain [Trypanosoma grayi]KEG12942.1 putative myosin heavy chain [Trypanosoma grayi]
MSALGAGDHVFFRHPEHSWVYGVIERIAKEGIVCVTMDQARKDVTPNETVIVKRPEDVELLQADALNDTPDDLLSLTVLHEATLLRCLYIRYMSDLVYTNIGAIVVALNPFTFSIPRYQDGEMKKYLSAGRDLTSATLPSNLVPHSWTQAHVTYYEMVDSASNQCIIVSGESGAGKTEATKIVLQYLGIVSSLSGSGEERKTALSVGERLVACSPVLECFGNAKTVRNDNSSRFGKFMKVKFNANHLVVGAETVKYLLEKSRIVSAAKGERVYHSFYLLARSRKSMARTLGLENENRYVSLCSGETANSTEYSSENDFDDVCRAMQKVGMKEAEITSVWRVPAAVMTLLNVRFLPGEDSCSIDPGTMNYLKKAVQLLDINESELIHEFLTSTRVLPGNQFAVKPNDIVTAVDVRDAMCKHLYDGVFGWLVDRCNDLCNVESDGNWIGLLDIFGFEDFEVNSFEQLCINLTNEHLQYHYNLHIFKRDMDECRKEGVDMTEVVFPDNTGCLKMLTAQGGIFPLLDECCWLGGGTDLGFLEKVAMTHESNPFFKKERVSRDTFCVRHYAGDVTYNVVGWIEKNRNTLKDTIKTIVRGSGDSIIARCLPAPIPLSERSKGGKEFTVSGFFRNQLTALIDLINSTNPHWIRCIKPHPMKKPRMFHGRQTMNQLESSGVLGTVKIRKAGYPVRIPRDAFCRRYRMCTSLTGAVEKTIIEDVLKGAKVQVPAQVQIGHTKVFLKAEAHNALERFRNQYLIETSMTLQRIGRGCLERHKLFVALVMLHKAELLRRKWMKTLEDMYANEAQLRQSREREEEDSWVSLVQLEEERRQYRAAIETAERERKRAEKEKRKREEEEEHRRLEEERRLMELRNRAAICIQRHVRGELVRIKVYRQLLEEQRAALEYERELACEKERREARAIDTERMADERSWTQWLNSVDHIKWNKQQDEERLLKKTLQRARILFRELVRKEDMLRLRIEVEESDARFVLVARCQSLAAHLMKSEAERRRRVEKLQAKRTEILRPQPAGIRARAERSTASDARIQKSLTEYALSRARLHDEMPEWRRVAPTPGRPLPKPGKEDSIFRQVRESWLRQQQWVNDGGVAQTTDHIPGPCVAYNDDDSQLNGPHRTIEASLKSISPLLQFPMQSTHLTLSGHDSVNTAEPSWVPREADAKKNKRMIDWDKVFRS